MSKSAFEITKLAFADVVTFRRLIQEIREQRVYRRMSYEHARSIILEYHQSDGDLSVLETAIEDLSTADSNC